MVQLGHQPQAGELGSGCSAQRVPGSRRFNVTSPPLACPVCGFRGLIEPPRSAGGGGSYEICAACGFEFGVTDDDEGYGYAARRARWVAEGMVWWSRPHRTPDDWDPVGRLLALLDSGRG